MREAKRLFTRIFLGVELLALSGWYFLSANGLSALHQSEAHNTQLLTELKQLENEIGSLKEEIDERGKDTFYKEKIAREELQMARTDEEIFILPK